MDENLVDNINLEFEFNTFCSSFLCTAGADKSLFVPLNEFIRNMENDKINFSAVGWSFPLYKRPHDSIYIYKDVTM